MLGNMMQQMGDIQAQLKYKLRSIIIEAEAGEGQVKVAVNATREITNVSIDPALF